jgi:hypothetical protein
MKFLSSIAAVVGLSLSLMASAFAADADPLVGKWIDNLPDGSAMIVEFTLKQVSFQQVTPDGLAVPPSTFGATYTKEAADKFGVTIEGQPNEPMALVLLKTGKLNVKFPGRNARELSRYVPEANAKPKAHP